MKIVDSENNNNNNKNFHFHQNGNGTLKLIVIRPKIRSSWLSQNPTMMTKFNEHKITVSVCVRACEVTKQKELDFTCWVFGLSYCFCCSDSIHFLSVVLASNCNDFVSEQSSFPVLTHTRWHFRHLLRSKKRQQFLSPHSLLLVLMLTFLLLLCSLLQLTVHC